MSARVPQDPYLAATTRIRRIRGKKDDPYEVIFVDQHGHIIVPLTEWYRIRKAQGPRSTRETYLACSLHFLSFLLEQKCPWNSPPERLRQALIAFHRDRLGCQIHPGKDGESMEIVPTRDTPLRPSTLRVLRAALRDFYLVLKEAGLYAFPNPLTSDVLLALKHEQERTLANRGAPDHAGIRAETHERSRRRPTAFLQHPKEQGWQPEMRRELADVRQGMHRVLDAMLDSDELSPREKAVLELLQNTGARLHEVILMTVGGYRNDGVAGQARVINKGSMGREIKTIYFAHSSRVEQALTTYIDQVRPLHDLQGRKRLVEVGNQEPLFLTERGTPYSMKAFYWHWYRHYESLRSLCPVRFSPHDIRHLFVSEYLITLKIMCGLGTDRFNSEQYLREREAFGSQVMGWRSAHTIDIYDQSRDGERTLSVLADYQKELSQRRYVSVPSPMAEQRCGHSDALPPIGGEIPATQSEETIWIHDAETMAWIKQMQQERG